MLTPRWRKVLKDLFGNKTRTILVVLSIAVGIFAVGMIAGTQVVLSNDLTTAYLAANPAAATIYTDSFNDELADTVRHVRGVADAQGRRSLGVRIQLKSGEWKNLVLTAIPDEGDPRINRVAPLTGAWPPPFRDVTIERASLEFYGLKAGDRVLVESTDGRQRTVTVSGTAHDINREPAMFSGQGYGYVTFDTLEWLGGSRDYTELSITVAENQFDKAHVQDVADRVRAKVESSGRQVYYTYVPEPGKHPIDSALQVLMTLLGVLGFLSLLLSGFLVVNTISALLTQQTRQIGIMKAIGARATQIMAMYFLTVVGFGTLALLIGIPLGLLAAYGLSSFMAGMLNFDVISTTPPPYVFGVEVAVGLAIPLLAAIWPVVSGVGVSVREALNADAAGQSGVGNGLIDRAINGIHGVSRPLLLSLRNTFRRKGRLALTLSTLILGGSIFIGVISVRESTALTLNDALDYFAYDFEVNLNRSARPDALVSSALRVPGVVEADTPVMASARRKRPNGTDSGSLFVLALPANTSLIKPQLVRGRWLLPEDENAIVVNTLVLKDESDVNLGDSITLKINEKDTTWQVVGVVRGVMTGPIMYANRPYFERVARTVGRASSLWVVTDKHDGASEAAVAAALEKQFKAEGMKVQSTQTISAIRSMVQSQFDIIVVFLLVMAVLLAVVGGLGLMGTMSLNVLERTREIGVMRAVGASNAAVRQVFIVEGILIGVLSWLVGAVLAYPLSRLLSDAVGNAFIQSPLSYQFSFFGAGLWLVLVVVLATLASLLPARNASRLTVRDVLAYE